MRVNKSSFLDMLEEGNFALGRGLARWRGWISVEGWSGGLVWCWAERPGIVVSLIAHPRLLDRNRFGPFDGKVSGVLKFIKTANDLALGAGFRVHNFQAKHAKLCLRGKPAKKQCNCQGCAKRSP
jgi:hypothetical protein